ncbi:MAG TPA: helix-turn-helix transcriptional regulator [Candidatus Limnocylindrales bacterium]|nr:helix-turn-helix transcriptional regulator [Candidatus Limnocylindrales bacterium]
MRSSSLREQRERPTDIGAARGREASRLVLRELRQARLDRNLSGELVGRAAGLSGDHYSRIERGLVQGITIEQASILLAAVGLDLSVRVYPGGEPLRDTAHAALLDRLRAELPRSLHSLAEVPFPAPGDRRAWDLIVVGDSWRHAFEAETRPRDLQALERRLALKARDGDVDGVSLLLLDSRHNREFVRVHRRSLDERFPVPGTRALQLLRAGDDPGAGSVILL